MIARAAEGSARDGLSILDQAIAHGGGAVTAEQVRDMLGLADRGRIRRLLEHVLAADAAATLADLDEAHDLGIDPSALLRGLMEELHLATRAKAGASAEALPVEQREAAERLADQLGWGQIHRVWQMLLKGLADVADRARSAGGGDDGAPASHPRCRSSGSRDRAVRLSGDAATAARSRSGAGSRQRSGCAASNRFPSLDRIAGEARQASACRSAPRSGRPGPLRAARTGAEAHATARNAIGRATWRGAQGRDRRGLAGLACPTSRASRHCWIRRKWPRSAFVPKCWPIPMSARRSRRSPTRAGILCFHERRLTHARSRPQQAHENGAKCAGELQKATGEPRNPSKWRALPAAGW